MQATNTSARNTCLFIVVKEDNYKQLCLGPLRTWSGNQSSALHQQRVRVFKPARHLGAVARLFPETLCVPFTAGHAEEVSTINVNGASQSRDRVGNGVNDVAPQRLSIFRGEGPGACRFNFSFRAAGHATPENVVLASGVDADHRP